MSTFAIQVHQRFCPFSHRPGTSVFLPGSNYLLKCYPSKVEFYDISSLEPKFLESLTLPSLGLVKEFTISQDLERGYVQLWGETPKGFFRLRFHALEGGSENKSGVGLSIKITLERNTIPVDDFTWDLELNKGKESSEELYASQFFEKLYLGNSKDQNWDAHHWKRDLTAIFPVWFAVGQTLKNKPMPMQIDAKQRKGVYALLDECKKKIEEKDKMAIVKAFQNLYAVAFSGVMAPSLSDPLFQGISLSEFDQTKKGDGKNSSKEAFSLTPLSLFSEGVELIRSLFFQRKENKIEILPCLPPEFHCGKLLRICCGEYGSLDIEWTKKKIRRMEFFSLQDTEVIFSLRNGVKTFRVRKGKKDRGEVLSANEPVQVKANASYSLDRMMY